MDKCESNPFCPLPGSTSESLVSKASSSVNGRRQLCLSPKARRFLLAGKVPSENKHSGQCVQVCQKWYTSCIVFCSSCNSYTVKSCHAENIWTGPRITQHLFYKVALENSVFTWCLCIHTIIFCHFEKYLKDKKRLKWLPVTSELWDNQFLKVCTSLAPPLQHMLGELSELEQTAFSWEPSDTINRIQWSRRNFTISDYVCCV